MPSFSIPLSGLQADSTALNTIANNLSNMNTTAYKAQTTSFSDMMSQQLGSTGSGDPIQVGSGVRVSATTSNFTQGSTSSTSVATDNALQGNGFFVVKGSQGQEFTRDGHFVEDPSGNLTTQDGLKVMGYPVDPTTGKVNPSAALTPIQLPVGHLQPALATGNMTFTANLAANSATAVTFPPVKVYDSLGVEHDLSFTLTPSATTLGQWSYQATVPGTDIVGGTAATPATLDIGTVQFNPDGTLQSVSSTTSGKVASGSATTPPTDSIAINTPVAGLADGASALKFNWNLFDASGKSSPLSQTASPSSMTSSLQDGYTSGMYESFSVSADGTVLALYNNGRQGAIGQLAVASVGNDQGLIRVGGNNYATTLASGEASIGGAGVGGRATVMGSALESSNVDISAEFSNLIVAQRAFEANSKAITTFDTVTQQAINMIR